MNFIDTPFVDVRVCWQPTRPAFLPRDRSPAASTFLLASPLLRGWPGAAAAAHGGYADRPPSDRVAYTAWQEWTVRPLDRGLWRHRPRLHQPQRRHRAQRAAHQQDRRLLGKLRPSRMERPHSGKPWSGAFVAWTMSHSGVSASDFPRDRAPRRLSRGPLRSQQRGGARLHAARAQRVFAQAGRSRLHRHGRPDWRHADSRTARRRIDSTANHCDVVTDVRGGYVQAIGGNVKNSVTMSLFPVDLRGRLVRSPGKPGSWWSRTGAVRRRALRPRRRGDGEQQQRRQRPARPAPPTRQQRRPGQRSQAAGLRQQAVDRSDCARLGATAAPRRRPPPAPVRRSRRIPRSLRRERTSGTHVKQSAAATVDAAARSRPAGRPRRRAASASRRKSCRRCRRRWRWRRCGRRWRLRARAARPDRPAACRRGRGKAARSRRTTRPTARRRSGQPDGDGRRPARAPCGP